MDAKPLAVLLLSCLSACVGMAGGQDFAPVDARTAALMAAKGEKLAAEVTAATDGKPAAAGSESAQADESRQAAAAAPAPEEPDAADRSEAAAPAAERPASGGLLAMFRNPARNEAEKAVDETAAAAPAPADLPDEFDEAAAVGEIEADPGKIAVPDEPVDDGLAHDFVNIYTARPERQKDMFEGLPGVSWQGGFVLASRGPTDGDPRNFFGGETHPYANVVPGMPRQVVEAANGLLLAHAAINVSCIKPDLLGLVRSAESHFNRRAVITSGYRSPGHNRRVRGALHSQHLYCNALDLYMPGVTRDDLARYFYDQPARGGLGVYCGTKSIHIDTGRRREWRWSCQRRG